MTRSTSVRPRSSRRALVLAAVLATVAVLAPTSARAATTWRVGPWATSADVDFTMVQDAIDAAVDGDVVEVLPGEYPELLDFRGKDVWIRSTDGPATTTINAHRDGTPVTFAQGEGRGAVLQGFTVRGGARTDLPGGGIQVRNAGPTIRGNIITDNRICGSGAGIDVSGGWPHIVDNEVSHNNQGGCSGGSGAGIHVGGDGGATTVIEGNDIHDNHFDHGGSGGGIGLNAAGDVVVRNNVIHDNSVYNTGGGISIVNRTRATIVHNVIEDNTANGDGGGIRWLVPSSGDPIPSRMVANTVVGNSGDTGPALHFDGRGTDVAIVNNVLVGDTEPAVLCGDGLNTDIAPAMTTNLFWAAGGPGLAGTCAPLPGSDDNIEADPVFAPDSLVPGVDSPLVDAGTFDPSLPTVDAAGNPRFVDGDGDGATRVDIGAFEAGEPVPPTAPGAPSALQATRYATTLLYVSWTIPADDGGAPITGYLVDVGGTVHELDGTTTWLSLEDETVADAMEVGVRAVNVAGPGPRAVATVRVELSIASEPTDITATRQLDGILVRWGKPEFDGGAPVLGYNVWWLVGDEFAEFEVGPDVREYVIPDPGDDEVFVAVMAFTEAGYGEWDSVDVPALTVPGAPATLTATWIDDEVTVGWTAPDDDGGSEVSHYDVLYGGGATRVDGDVRELVLPVTTGGHVSVRAVNDVGLGPLSTADVVDLATPPGPVSDVTVQVEGDELVVSWSPPVDDGGAAVDGYRVSGLAPETAPRQVGAGTTSVRTTAPPAGSTRTVAVEALTRAGWGPPASVSVTVPATTPAAPTDLSVEHQRGSDLVLTWAPPTADGGSPVTGYEVREVVTGHVLTTASDTTTVIVSGVSKKSPWEVEVRAVNEIGTSPAATAGSSDGGGGGDAPRCHPTKGC